MVGSAGSGWGGGESRASLGWVGEVAFARNPVYFPEFGQIDWFNHVPGLVVPSLFDSELHGVPKPYLGGHFGGESPGCEGCLLEFTVVFLEGFGDVH